MSPKSAADMPSTDIASFVAHLQKSKRIGAVLGAGLSASSGLPTFRGPGGLWRTHDAVSLATPEAFQADPALVWQFYSYRRHMALRARPNRAHLALAELARKRPGFITLSQNVDGLSPRAGHPPEQLFLLHGNLFDVKCWDEDRCGYIRESDLTDPIVPALAIPEDPNAGQATTAKVQKDSDSSIAKDAILAKKHADVSNVNVALPTINSSDLPHCPSCKKNLLRPGVVWFGEALPHGMLELVDAWIRDPEGVDLMLVIGTSSKVYPAAGFADEARDRGARVAVINMDRSDARHLTKKDWFFEGDAAVIVPEILKSIVGEIGEFQEQVPAQE